MADSSFQFVLHKHPAHFFHFFSIPALFQGDLVQVSHDQHILKVSVLHRQVSFPGDTQCVKGQVAPSGDLGIIGTAEQIVNFRHISPLIVHVLKYDLVCQAVKHLKIVLSHVLCKTGQDASDIDLEITPTFFTVLI